MKKKHSIIVAFLISFILQSNAEFISPEEVPNSLKALEECIGKKYDERKFLPRSLAMLLLASHEFKIRTQVEYLVERGNLLRYLNEKFEQLSIYPDLDMQEAKEEIAQVVNYVYDQYEEAIKVFEKEFQPKDGQGADLGVKHRKEIGRLTDENHAHELPNKNS
jgi:hypothetical protein